MGATPTQEDALHAALHHITEDRDMYSPAGLASEVVRAIEAEYPQFKGALSAVVGGLLCREEDIMSILSGVAQQLAYAEAEAADRQVAEEARGLPDGALARLVHDATGK